MNNWIDKAIFYHIYPLGFCGAPLKNEGGEPVDRLKKVLEWLPHLKEMSVNAIYFGPVFESVSHGYDTNDYQKVDVRLGDNASFKNICDTLHANGIRVVLDGVFNHVGRGFWAFLDVLKNKSASKYVSWFCNVNFSGNNCYNDNFSYEAWQGHSELVKLNLSNPEVTNYLLDSVKLWIEEFGIDGLRLDAADCVRDDFFRSLRSATKAIRPDFWLVGEIIHGDYRHWANEQMLDSVTNYECHKGIYSSHNEKNYFEIAYSLNRQFGTEALYRGIRLYNFVDNHDVNRLASMLKNKNHLKNVYTILYTMPGVPSIYYGSEWGILGERDKTTDYSLRPCLDLGKIPAPNDELLEHIVKLGKLRLELSALQNGDYTQVQVKNEQLIYRRANGTQTVFIVLNLSENSQTLDFKINGTSLVDGISGKKIDAKNGGVSVNIGGFGSMILTEENSTSPTNIQCEERTVIVGGKYHHFKGGDYVVTDIGRNSETLEEMVVYKEINGAKNTWIRPLKMFAEDVNDFGNIKQRFKLCE
ncbi:MAG: DUF1653 domain-containing protein [Oscillospiraceae bacterium]